MRAMLDRLFAGRNGVDQLNIALFVLAILFWMASLFFSYLRLFAAVPWALLVGSGILHCAGAFEKPWTTAAGEPEVFELVPWRARWS